MMSTVLEYPCSCKYYSDSTTIVPMHLCDSHKTLAYADALRDFIKRKTPEE